MTGGDRSRNIMNRRQGRKDADSFKRKESLGEREGAGRKTRSGIYSAGRERQGVQGRGRRSPVYSEEREKYGEYPGRKRRSADYSEEREEYEGYSGRKRRGPDIRGGNRRRRRRTYRRRIILTLLAVFILAVGGGKVWSFSEEGRKSSVNENISVNLGELYSNNAIFCDAESGEKLAAVNAGKRIYPASLTKIMTALIAVEETEDMDGTMVLPSDYFSELYEENASMAGFLPGEQANLRDLLYGILLPSGAECCLAFAEEIAGSEEAFAERMNEKAKELGMRNTHFCNATGLHNPEHYSTAEDMAVLLRAALRETEFREAFTSQSRSVPPSDMHPNGFTFTSTMFQKLENPAVAGGAILGGKTGYTPEAGLCLASLAQVNGKEYILVTANAKGSHDTEQFHILDAVNVYNQIGTADEG